MFDNIPVAEKKLQWIEARRTDGTATWSSSAARRPCPTGSRNTSDLACSTVTRVNDSGHRLEAHALLGQVRCIRLESVIAAPVGDCFDLSLSVDAHAASMRGSGESAIGGVTSGIM